MLLNALSPTLAILVSSAITPRTHSAPASTAAAMKMARTKRAAQTTGPPPAAAAAKPSPTAAINPKKRKNRRYAKKIKPSSQPNTTNTTTPTTPTTKPSPTHPIRTTTAAYAPTGPSDTWRRIAVDPDLVALREVATEGEGSGLIALEEMSGRAFKGKVRVLTMDDVRRAAGWGGEGEVSGGVRRLKRRRSELVPRLDGQDEAKASSSAAQDERDGDEHEQQAAAAAEHEAGMAAAADEPAQDVEMDGEVEAAEDAGADDEDGVEFDMAELNGEEDEEATAATAEAQRILELMRDEDDDSEHEDEEEAEAEAAVEETESAQVKQEQEQQQNEQDEDGDEPVSSTDQQPTKSASQPDLSNPPPPTAWDAFNLHPLLLHALHTLGFHTPTPIQSACLPQALVQRSDIIAAAHTGSGKTLTFALPVLNGLLLSGQPAMGATGAAGAAGVGGGVVALVLVPTRELALQVAMHVRAAAQYVTWVKCCVLVGGLSQHKQLRQLAAHPHIVIATPGRLCELMAEGELKGWQALRYLVLDEADRMVERGLGAEVEKVMTTIDRQRAAAKEAGVKISKLQHFFFSATLSLPEVGRENLKLKRQPKKRQRVDGNHEDDDEAGMVAYFTSLCSTMAGRPHVVDLTAKRRLVGGLSEYIIPCVIDDKDYYVYALLLQQPPNTKTILFVNAISCLRRLASLLTLLTLPIYPLHAEMQQRQRLKNLDRFTSSAGAALLLCTDVAARGLDLPSVPLVVHYQLPGAVDVYIHRVGRTARAGAVGVSVALVSEEDGRAWQRINSVVRGGDGGRDDVERWKVDDRLMAVSRERMTIARKLDRLLNRQRQHKHTSDWLQRQAQQMDILLDDDTLPAHTAKRRKPDAEDGPSDAAERADVRRLQAQLDALLRRRVADEKRHARFFTLNVVEELEKRADEQRRQQQVQAAKDEQDKKATRQASAGAAGSNVREAKVPATTKAQKAKAEAAAGGSSEQKEDVTEASGEGQEATIKVEAHAVKKHKQSIPIAAQPPLPFKATSALKAKQPAKPFVSKKAAVVTLTNGNHHQQQRPAEVKESSAADKPEQACTPSPSREPAPPAAAESVNGTKEAKQNGTAAQPAAVSTVSNVAGETQKLGKRAKKNLRKQKQKLAATAGLTLSAAQPEA